MENQNSSQMTNINMRVTFQEKSLLSEQAQEQNTDLTNFLKSQLFEELPRLKNYKNSAQSRENQYKEMERELESKKGQIKELENSLAQYNSMLSLNQLYKNAAGKICQVGNRKIEINSKLDLIESLALNYQIETTK
jgi:uncharacterized protein (DUF1778 family)